MSGCEHLMTLPNIEEMVLGCYVAEMSGQRIYIGIYRMLGILSMLYVLFELTCAEVMEPQQFSEIFNIQLILLTRQLFRL